MFLVETYIFPVPSLQDLALTWNQAEGIQVFNFACNSFIVNGLLK
jgi:hypothetical protein